MTNEQIIINLQVKGLTPEMQTEICDQARAVVRSRVGNLLSEVLSEEEQKEFSAKFDDKKMEEADFQAWVDKRFPQIAQLQEAVMEDYIVELKDRLKAQLG